MCSLRLLLYHLLMIDVFKNICVVNFRERMFFFYIFYIWMLCTHVYLLITLMQCLQRSEESMIHHRIGIKDGPQQPCGCWKLELWALERQSMLLANDPFQKSLNLFIYFLLATLVKCSCTYFVITKMIFLPYRNYCLYVIFFIFVILPKYVDVDLTTVIQRL